MINLPPKASQILQYLRFCGCPKTPTEIGMHFGRSYDMASGWAAAPLRQLVTLGVVRRLQRPVQYEAIK